MRLHRILGGLVLFGLAASVAPAQDEADFVPIFNGKDLTGWVGATESYEVKDGVLACKAGGKGNLFTEKEYGDFVFRFEFKLTPGANNGVGLRAPLEGDAAYVGMESQIIDDSTDRFGELKSHQKHGSIYGIAPAKVGAQQPVGEWNVEEITLKGRRAKVVLNGETIVDVDLDEVSTPKTIDGQDHPGLKRAKGHLGFLSHGDRVEFRNLRIKELTAP